MSREPRLPHTRRTARHWPSGRPQGQGSISELNSISANTDEAGHTGIETEACQQVNGIKREAQIEPVELGPSHNSKMGWSFWDQPTGMINFQRQSLG